MIFNYFVKTTAKGFTVRFRCLAGAEIFHFVRLVQTISKADTTFHSILLAVSFPIREAADVKTVHLQPVVRLGMCGFAHPLPRVFIVTSFFLQSVLRPFDLLHLLRVRFQRFGVFRLVMLKIQVLGFVTPLSLVNTYRRSDGS